MSCRDQIVDRIAILRQRAGLTAKALSLRINRSSSYIAKVESRNHFPSIDDLELIVNACASSFEELFYENFDSYAIDKEVLKRLKAVTKDGKHAMITLLVLLQRQDEEFERKEKEKEKGGKKR